jgi:hypothetical protein
MSTTMIALSVSEERGGVPHAQGARQWKVWKITQ